MKLNINSIVSKISKNADMLGSLYGYLAPMAAINTADPWGAIFHEHEQLLTGFRIPDAATLRASFEHSKPILKTAIMAYIAGEVGSGFGGDIGKYSNLAKKIGMGMTKGVVASIIVMALGGSGIHKKYNLPNGGGHSSGGNSPTWKYPA